MTLEEFEKELDEKFAQMSEKELKLAMTKVGFEFEDSDSQTDYKNSLKNDY